MKNCVLSTPVGQMLEGVEVTGTDHDLELLIVYCARNSSESSADGDKDRAIKWARLMNQCIQNRRPEIVEAWDRARLREIDDGVGYFSSQQAQELGRTA